MFFKCHGIHVEFDQNAIFYGASVQSEPGEYPELNMKKTAGVQQKKMGIWYDESLLNEEMEMSPQFESVFLTHRITFDAGSLTNDKTVHEYYAQRIFGKKYGWKLHRRVPA